LCGVEKKLVATPAALRLAEHAKEVVRMMGHIQQLFENDLAKDVRPFHFATGVTTLIYQLTGPLRQLRKRYPNAEIRVTVGSHFFQKYRVAGHRLTRSLALAMAKTDCPRKLRDSIASFLRSTL
jgi:DNA-binding transcriptional LysR family regulator